MAFRSLITAAPLKRGIIPGQECCRSSGNAVFWTSCRRRAATSSRAAGGKEVVEHHGARYLDEVTTAHDHAEGLRPRQCCEPSCCRIFAVCANCDRGQRYCSEPCRSRRRRNQVRAAGKRYQASEAGKSAHCRRQKAYRERRNEAPVTHQATATITKPITPEQFSMGQCAICGRSNR